MTTAYQEKILDHYHNPRHRGRLNRATHRAEGLNTSCGDKIRFELLVKDDLIVEIAFDGEGCAISQAAGSILSEYLLNKDIETLKKMTKNDMLKLLEIPLSPARLKCALLALETAQRAIVRQS